MPVSNIASSPHTAFFFSIILLDNMAFFQAGDGDGGTATDRVAIVVIVGLAFSWIPVMVV